MCEAHAYMLRDDQEEKIFESVDQLEIEGDEVRMINIFGEQKILKAKFKSYQNQSSKILLVPL